jgi:ribonuclease P protein component
VGRDTIHLTRLKTRAEFVRVTRARNSAGQPGLVLQACPTPQPTGETSDAATGRDDPRARVGFTASRKIGNAVARNRAKRRLRALSAEILARHGTPDRDYVLIARAATPTRPYAALRKDLEKALRRLTLWRDDPAAADQPRPEI